MCVCMCMHTRVYTLAFLLLFSFSLKFNTTPCGQFRGYLGSLSFTPHTPWKVCFVLRLRLSPHLHRFGMTPCGELQMQTIQMGDELLLAGQTIYRCVCVCVCVLVLHTRTTTTLLFLFFGCFCFDCLLYCSTFAFDFLVPCRSCFAVAVAVVVAVAVIWFSHFSLFSVSHDYTNTLTHVHTYIYLCVCVCVLKKMPSEQHFVAMFGAAPSKNKGGWGWGKWSLCWSPHLSPSSTFNARNERAMT